MPESRDLLLLAAAGGALFLMSKGGGKKPCCSSCAHVGGCEGAADPYASQRVDPLIYGWNPLADSSIWAPGDIGSGFTGRHH